MLSSVHFKVFVNCSSWVTAVIGCVGNAVSAPELRKTTPMCFPKASILFPNLILEISEV
jgi:hypothetical protein